MRTYNSLRNMGGQMSSERAIRIAELIASFLTADVFIHNFIRSAFDELYANRHGGAFIKPNGRAQWFNKSDLRNSSIRTLLLGDFKHRSPDAENILDGYDRTQDLPDDVDLICEHVVPCGILERMLRDDAAAGIVTPEHVFKFQDKYYRRCILTADENAKLSKNAMPDDWCRESGKVFARYIHAGFLWADRFD